jgi:hypothetical protein
MPVAIDPEDSGGGPTTSPGGFDGAKTAEEVKTRDASAVVGWCADGGRDGAVVVTEEGGREDFDSAETGLRDGDCGIEIGV